MHVLFFAPCYGTENVSSRNKGKRAISINSHSSKKKCLRQLLLRVMWVPGLCNLGKYFDINNLISTDMTVYKEADSNRFT